MTISTTSPVIQYAGDGGTVNFAVPFRFDAAAFLEVSVMVIATGVESIKTLTTHYTVAGSTVTMLAAPAVGERLTIRRIAPLEQGTDYDNTNEYDLSVLEADLDEAAMHAQQVEAVANRALKFPKGDLTSLNSELPSAALRANKALTFDSAGEPTVTTITGDTAIAAHVAEADPHTQYQKESEKGQINGYASLDGAGTIPDSEIPPSITRDSELSAYQATSEKGAANGYAGLDAGGVVPDAQLPAALARDAEVTAAIAAHAGLADPHVVYQKESEKGQFDGYASLDGAGDVPDAQIPASIARSATVAADIAAAVTAHEALADPHIGYQKESEKGAANGYPALDATGRMPEAQLPSTAALDADVTSEIGSAITAHEGLADPHTGYQKESEKGGANGYASLDAGGLVPVSQLPAAAIGDHDTITGLLENMGIAVTLDSPAVGDLLIDIKQGDNTTDPSAGAPVRVQFSARKQALSQTAAASVKLDSLDHLGLNLFDNTKVRLYVYAIDRAGTLVWGVSRRPDYIEVITGEFVTADGAATDIDKVKVSAAVTVGDKCRVVAFFLAEFSTDWSVGPASHDLFSFPFPPGYRAFDALELLAIANISGDAAVDFKLPQAAVSTLKHLGFMFLLHHIRPATDGADLIARVSIDGGATFGSTLYSICGRVETSINTTASMGNPSYSSMPLHFPGEGIDTTAADNGLSGQFYLFAPNIVAAKKVMVSRCGVWGNTFNEYRYTMSSGRWEGGNAAINAIRFIMTSGNFSTGRIAMYAIRGQHLDY